MKTNKFDFIAVFFAIGLLAVVGFYIYNKDRAIKESETVIITKDKKSTAPVSTTSTSSVATDQLLQEIQALKQEIEAVNIQHTQAETAIIESKLRAQAAEAFKDDPESLRSFKEHLDRINGRFNELDERLQKAQQTLQEE